MGFFDNLKKGLGVGDLGPSGLSGMLESIHSELQRSQTVDSFVRLGASADTSEVRPLVSQVADFFKQIDIGSRDFAIEAPDVYNPSTLSQVGRTVRGQDVVRRTAIAMVSPDAFESATGESWGKGTIGFHRTITPGNGYHSRIMDFLKTEGIAFSNPDEIDNFIFMSGPMAVSRGAENTVLDIGHEVTHAIFGMAGAGEEGELAQQALYREESTLRDLIKQIDDSSIPLGDKIRRRQKGYS